ncbi:E3 ubiquitin-protein ligase HERC3 [Pyrus ussuriensis x Pyrus communis]|uniref:E3 ubiquitin-protein ligase HERC3 n=1 Tax=Pyrus ussuriensis x Pyrus communis TaxID=2448454 RepID=A0A5N5I974_9ROSA|nr:E3 ubiquitin-protein ligase HERC3 [Pyrus ussuriensis x Pyrus communis]
MGFDSTTLAATGEVYTWGWKECVPSGNLIGDLGMVEHLQKDTTGNQSSLPAEQGISVTWVPVSSTSSVSVQSLSARRPHRHRCDLEPSVHTSSSSRVEDGGSQPGFGK